MTNEYIQSTFQIRKLESDERIESFDCGDAVNFIEKEDTPLLSGLLHAVIDRGNDLAHRVFRFSKLRVTANLSS